MRKTRTVRPAAGDGRRARAHDGATGGGASRSRLPSSRGRTVTPAFEGWYPNKDGTYSISFGYYNRNSEEIVDIPIGPDNFVAPGDAESGAAIAILRQAPLGRVRGEGARGLRPRSR